MSEENQKLIKKAKRKRYGKLVLFLVIAAVSFLFLGSFEVITNGNAKTYGAGLPEVLVIIIVVLEFFGYMLSVSVDVARTENYLLHDCDPEKFAAVRLNAFSKNFTSPSDVANVLAIAAFASGDFEACINHAMRIESEKKSVYRLSSAFSICKASFFLGNKENMKIALSRAHAEIQSGKSKLGAKESESALRQLEMLCLLSDGNIKSALQYADSVQPCDAGNYHVASCSYYRGLVYRAAGERMKAIHCFMTASEKGGKTFLKTESDKALKALEKEEKE